MLLKKLEMIGFKSFADRTEFIFDHGITAIVGPNGCGKSNVVDAVKWILGEQSVKSLRGKEMADVIFSGTTSRKSHGFAEATITFDNTDRKLSLDFDEVTITRRVFRSGEGAYFINKQPCRLKDIKNLLLDTGLGMQCYSVIEQGKIDQILVTSTAERRRVFDEAAGISKYKARRKEAQNKLDRVEQNLLRLNDIVDEVEKQLRSVKYQAAKARRYREYNDEFKRLRVSYSLQEYDDLKHQASKTGENLRGLAEGRARLFAQSEQTEDLRSRCESRVIELQRSQESAQSLLAEARQAATAAEDSIRYNRARVQEQKELESRYEIQSDNLTERVALMRMELEEKASALEKLRAELDSAQRILDEKGSSFSKMDYEERELARDLNEKKGAVVGIMQQTSRLENDLSVALSEKRRLETQSQRQETRLIEVVAELNESNMSVSRAQEEIEAVGRIIVQLDGQTAEKQTELREANSRLVGFRDELAERLQHQSSLGSRLEVLVDLDEKQEGVEQGVKQVLDRMREAGHESSGLHGMLGENLKMDSRYARAVEAALGHRSQTLVVENLDHAMAGVTIVNEEGQGRASFVPLSHCKDKTGVHELPEGILGRLKDLVECDERHRPVVNGLLGDVLLVEDMTRACTVSAQSANGFVIVTLAGEVIEPTGIIAGGRGISGGGIVSRAAERQDLEVKLDEVQSEIRSLRDRVAQGQDAEAAIGTEIQRLAELVEREKNTRNTRLASIERLKEKQRILTEEHDIIESERSDVIREMAELDDRERELRIKLDDAKREDKELEDRIELLGKSHEEVSNRRLALQEEMTEIKVSLAGSHQQEEGLQAAISNLGANLRIREEEIEQLAINIEDARSKQIIADEEIARRGEELEKMRVREQEQQAIVLGLTNSREELSEEMASLDKASRDLRHSLAEMESSLGDLRLEAQEVNLKMENLVERALEDYQIDLLLMAETWQAEDMNWDEVAERIEELRRKLGSMGNVNHDAIRNEEALSRRAEFLNGQRSDLSEARRQLEDIIGRLNSESVERFRESFAVIRENFQEMFRKLFGGGKADLFLEDEQNILESGVEIIARPPGKEPRALSLLSGGEKVMTAVALLFAIFKSRPSPFCVLDEVDAALDEANIGRFSNILQEFLEHSQFIIITHSKRTMAVANVIYGITMPESGVSTKISVKFEDYEAQVA